MVEYLRGNESDEISGGKKAYEKNKLFLQPLERNII